jgi:type II secretory pathway pseudopilin PulG
MLMLIRPTPSGRGPANVAPERRRSEAGLTLVELIISIGVLGILMLALTAITFTTFKVDTQTKSRLNSTRNSQIASVYFGNDAQSARPSGGVVTSGTAACDATKSTLVDFLGNTYDPDAVTTPRTFAISYVLQNATVNGLPAKELHRLRCESGVTPTLISDIVVARALAVSPVPGVAVAGTRVTLQLAAVDGTTFSLVGTRRTT